MEFYTSPLLLVLTAVITILLLKFVSIVYHDYMFWKKRGVPHMPSVPLIGSSWKVLLRMQSFPDHFVEIYNAMPNAKYIGVMDLRTPIVMVRDLELIKEITVKSFEHFTDHRIFMDDNVDSFFTRNLFALKGDRWKEMRTTLSPSFTASKMKFMFTLVSDCSRDFVDYLAEHPECWKSMKTKDVLSRYTTDVIATAAFGISINSMKEPKNEFYVKGTSLMALSTFRLMLMFLLMRIFPKFSNLCGIKFPSNDTRDFFFRVVKETLTARKEKGIMRPDMIHLLMQAQDKERENNHEMTTDDIVAQAFLFFIAGFETTSNVMAFVVHELSVNPDIQERLREEVDRYFAEGNGEITYDALSKMEYMEMVISETMRMYPPLAILDRSCVKSFKLPPATPDSKEFTIEPGTYVWLPVFAIHRNPQYFPDPEKFDPERFSEQNKANILPYTYMPFGLGPRMCIANRFALMEAKILIAHLLRKFVVKRSDKMRHPIVFRKSTFNVQADEGFWIDLEKRN